MKFKITTLINDDPNKTEAPGFEIDENEFSNDVVLGNILYEEFIDDSGKYYPVGATITIERVE